MADPLTDPCGNPLPIPFPALPSGALPLDPIALASLIASLLGLPNVPAIAEPATPCPVLLDSARAAGGV